MEEKKIIINGHEAVDLGLSVKWATCNIGAINPEDLGEKYHYGEIEPVTDRKIKKTQYNLNERPREKLNFSTPKECFYKFIS